MNAFGNANLVAAAGVGAGWLLFLVGVLILPRPPTGAGAKRDLSSTFGIALQGVGIGAAWFGPMRLDLAAPTRAELLAGVGPGLLALASGAFFVWAATTLGKQWALVARVREDHVLIERGPFAIVRNPIYLALLGMLVATALALGHAWSLLAAVPVFLAGTLQRIGREEKLLRATFPDSYPAYAQRVKRLVPGIF